MGALIEFFWENIDNSTACCGRCTDTSSVICEHLNELESGSLFEVDDPN